MGQKQDLPVDNSLPPKVMGEDATRLGIDLNDKQTFYGRFISIKKKQERVYRLKAETEDGKVMVFESFPIAVTQEDLQRSGEKIKVTYVNRPNADGSTTKVVHAFHMDDKR